MKHRRSKQPASGSTEQVVAVGTDAGMLTLWSPAPFAGIGDDYEAFEARVEDRLSEAIEMGELVPINIESDGAWGVRVDLSSGGLSDREQAYALVTSEQYLLVVSGGEACVSGLESVGDPSSAAIRFPLDDGRYSVRATIVAWDEEPGAMTPDGNPGPSALPGFVIHIEPETSTSIYRTNEVTFDPPE